ncbi:hypothetical protein A2Y83_01370 [Candidatus Falkowbacteria bacterium RBG_13_39_14]|uniref:Uncharacterized protein n=1 Tax=Candidatus Falkowbacteria bacterium RBG_13_39_14 TaxID=1797985 RepID=A0A1F5S9K5_9BACT|nr:MAG: hypothetical protein A2Y83_01370 [Candidatus Falkowbacteria bacterium RBG_13_39_14]
MDYKFDRPEESKSKEKAILFSNHLIRWLIYAMVFLVPLFFLPDTVDFFDYNKQYLIWLITGISALIWFFRMIILEGRVIWKRTPLDIPVLIFLAANFLIYLFSIDRFLSLWGSYGTFSQSFLNVLAFVLLFFVVTNNF